MTIKSICGAALAAAAIVMTGCQTVPGTIIAKSKPIEQGQYTVVADEVSATEMQVYLFGWPLSDLRGSAGRRMYKNALKQAPGADALIEYTTDLKTFGGGPILFTWYTLTGVPVKTTK